MMSFKRTFYTLLNVTKMKTMSGLIADIYLNIDFIDFVNFIKENKLLNSDILYQ